MYLEKLEIHGFKSFANPTTLVFNRQLTAVVGPNGSGKSNITDAVRWVLGEQSIKTLRGKKADDVIFAGSDKKSRLGFAEVSLHLNNADRLAEVDYDQIIVSRRIDRKGESEYLINNNKVRLLDVQLLLAKAKFGQKTYSIIGQGMVDSILTTNAAERKEFFDEATGVRQFQIKKEQAIHKLDNAKVNLAQTGQILAELEPRVKSLTRQVKRLERREQSEKELQELQTSYYSFLSNNLNKDLAAKQGEFKKSQAEVSALNQQLIDLQTKLDQSERSSTRHDNFQSLQKKLSNLQDELNVLLKEKTVLEGKADLQLMSAGKVDTVWLKNRLQTLQNEINSHQLSLSQVNKDLQDKQVALKNLEEKQAAVLADFKVLEDQLQNQAKEITIKDFAEDLATIISKQDKIWQELESLADLAELPKVKTAWQNLSQQISELYNKAKQATAAAKLDWQLEFNKLLVSKDTLVAEVNEAKTKVMLLSKEAENFNQQIKKNQEEIAKVELDLKALTAQAASGEIAQQVKVLEQKISLKEKELEKITEEIKDFNQAEEAKKSSLVADQKSFREIQYNFNLKNNILNEIKVELARLETRQEELNKEISEEIKDLQVMEVKSLDVEATREQIQRLKQQLSLIGGIDEGVLAEYQEVNDRYEFLSKQSGDLTEAISHLEKVIKDLDEAISEQFNEAFKNINQLFSKYFKQLFNGGKAQLTLEIKEVPLDKQEAEEDYDEDDEDDEEEEAKEKPAVKTKKEYGIEIMATPPGKKLASINMLSGGEKAMTSIALICAIIANNPSPFIFLDEVDAALDEANSIRLAEILEELSDKTQFIAVTHNRATMHQAKIIYGVTMGDDGVSSLLSMNFEQADEIAA